MALKLWPVSIVCLMFWVACGLPQARADLDTIRHFFKLAGGNSVVLDRWVASYSEGLVHGSRFKIVGYYEPALAFDSEQNRLLTLQALDNAYYVEVSEITQQCRLSMEEMKPQTILHTRRRQFQHAKAQLENDLLQAKSSRRKQMAAFATYYEDLQDVLTRRPILQLNRRYRWTVTRLDEISHFFQDKLLKVNGDPMPPNWGLEYNSERIKKSCENFLRYGTALESQRSEIIEILTERVRERQILNQEYVGIYGKMQRLMDFVDKKGIYGSRQRSFFTW